MLEPMMLYMTQYWHCPIRGCDKLMMQWMITDSEGNIEVLWKCTRHFTDYTTVTSEDKNNALMPVIGIESVWLAVSVDDMPKEMRGW